jgi:hypothetical protein
VAGPTHTYMLSASNVLPQRDEMGSGRGLAFLEIALHFEQPLLHVPHAEIIEDPSLVSWCAIASARSFKVTAAVSLSRRCCAA